MLPPPTPAYRQALNLAWYRAGRLPFPTRGGGLRRELSPTVTMEVFFILNRIQ